ncbi:MAG: SH3 domain-containing protein [Syntrophomonadaceae bacterium]|nr:SH3 domain-containing protein [Syntrophomonadaceae bacterium]
MTWKRRAMIFSLAGLLALFSAFSLGRMVAADTNTGPAPGSAEDPLVSRSYVDLKTSEVVKALEGRIKALEERVAELEKKLGSSTGTPPDTGTPAGGSQVYTRAGRNWANIRTGPSTSAALLTQCYPGTAMTLLATQGDWYQVKMPDGKVGWVHNSVAEVR